MNLLNDNSEAVVTSATAVVTQKATAYIGTAGATSAIIFGLTANEIAALGGLCIAALAFAVNAGITFYFKYRHLKLMQEVMERNTIMHLPTTEQMSEMYLVNNVKRNNEKI